MLCVASASGNSLYSPSAPAAAPEKSIVVTVDLSGDNPIAYQVDVTDLGYGDFDIDHVRRSERGAPARRQPAEPAEVDQFWLAWANEDGLFDAQHGEITQQVREALND